MSNEAGRRMALRRLMWAVDKDPAFQHLRDAGSVLVPGRGSMVPRVVFVGEAPGATENKLRIPFCGASGKLLDKMLASIGMGREEVFITNVVKYRPPGNRTPTDQEIDRAHPHLRAEMTVVGRPPIVALGKSAAQAVLWSGHHHTVGEWTYSPHMRAAVLPLRHPAYGLYQVKNQPEMFEQFKAILQETS